MSTHDLFQMHAFAKRSVLRDLPGVALPPLALLERELSTRSDIPATAVVADLDEDIAELGAAIADPTLDDGNRNYQTFQRERLLVRRERLLGRETDPEAN